MIESRQNFINIRDKIGNTINQFSDLRNQVELYCKNQLFTTHWQVSDFFQHFLCTQDQMRLINYDNKKFGQFNEWWKRETSLKQFNELVNGVQETHFKLKQGCAKFNPVIDFMQMSSDKIAARSLNMYGEINSKMMLI